MNKRVVSDLERNNKVALICHATEAVIIAGTFLTEAAVGSRTVWYGLIVAVLALVPVAAELFFWFRDHETKMIKHLAAQGFAVMYTFILFTTTNSMTFLYVIPMLVMITIFNDPAYSVKINVGTTLESFIVVIGGAMTGKFGFRDMGSGLLQLLVMVLVGVYSYLASKTMNDNNGQKLETIRRAQSETETLLDDVSGTSRKMQEGINDIYEKVEQLKAESRTTRGAMEEVASGANDTAEAVQLQLRQTEAIVENVERVGGAAAEITNRMQQTLAVLSAGKRDVEELVREVEISVRDSENVAGQLKTLDEYIDEMNSIVEIIGNITAQTSLLALNASIEAARAGEAGRGFAVVATEISTMASQTKEATAHITELIGNVSGAISSVVAVIRGMIEGINMEKTSTRNTAESFAAIEQHTFAIRDNVARLMADVEVLEYANQEITKSIHTISAVSEEVSAHANETLAAEERNMENLIQIASKSGKMMELTKH